MSPETSLQDPLRFHRKSPPCAVVIYGANGDLTKRKLMPALYRLAYEGRLAPGFAVMGVSRTAMTDDEFRDRMHESVKKFLEDSPFDEDLWKSFAQGIFYQAGDVGDPSSFPALANCLKEVEKARKTEDNVLYYLSTQPSQYAEIAEGLAGAGMNKGNGWRRIVIEKPFGHDLAERAGTARPVWKSVFEESEIYRIDHYLGKETVQNIMAFRFGNGIFEPLWNRRYIDHVQITAAESIGVEGRGAYYQEAGALRDMIQNHLLQVMATVTMEPAPLSRATRCAMSAPNCCAPSASCGPEQVAENAVAGPVRTGPRGRPAGCRDSGRKRASIPNRRPTPTPPSRFWWITGAGPACRFTSAPARLCPSASAKSPSSSAPRRWPCSAKPRRGGEALPNVLILRIQPEEGISLKFVSKRPGSGMQLRPVSMDFNYGSSFGERSPSAYETLLLDAISGDATLYTRQDMVEASWQAVQPILDYWSTQKFDFPNYAAGTWGPEAADEMLARCGHTWRKP